MLPHVVLHNAVSVDGRVDWFTPDVGKFYELAAYWKEDATLAGADTLLKAYPEDRVPPEDKEAFEHEKSKPLDTRPLLVVPDSRGRIRRILPMLRHEPYWRDTLILTSKSTPRSYLEFLDQRKINCISTGNEHVDYKKALEELNSRYGVKVVRVDSGGTLNGALLRAGLVNEVSLLIHPNLVGGISPGSVYKAPDLIAATGVLKLKLIRLEQPSEDVVWLRYEVLKTE
jgi:2,5-diamino-6-(ribosylamino)-4(3H)-pyrimidinone 5'-phosphate reductase